MICRNVVIDVCLSGNYRSGKTTFLHKEIKNQFNIPYYPTIGADFRSKQILIDRVDITLRLWDPFYQDKFDCKTCYRFIKYFIVLYDVNDKKSFDEAISTIKYIKKVTTPNYIMLVGNKIDIGKRIVTTNEILSVVTELQCDSYYEISLKNNSTTNIITEIVLQAYSDYEISLNKFTIEKEVEKEIKDDNTSYFGCTIC
ncbi:Ras-related protein Rab-1 [Entamoeba marina]